MCLKKGRFYYMHTMKLIYKKQVGFIQLFFPKKIHNMNLFISITLSLSRDFPIVPILITGKALDFLMDKKEIWLCCKENVKHWPIDIDAHSYKPHRIVFL